jgi:hypothetical protein
MRIEWLHPLSCMLLLLALAVILERFHFAPPSGWVVAALIVPMGLFVWVAPMFFWNYVYRHMGWGVAKLKEALGKYEELLKLLQ